MRLSGKNEELRRGRVTASVIAALLPCGHPFVTKGDLYAGLVAGVTRPRTPIMEMGQFLEDAIFELGKRDYPSCRRNGRTYIHESLPIGATPDGIGIRDRVVIDCKNTSAHADDWWSGPPPHIVAQVQTQMLVTGRTQARVWVLFGGARFGEYVVDADPDWQQGIEYAVWAFFREHVDPRIPPPDTPARYALTLTRPEGVVRATDYVDDLGRTMLEARASAAAAERRADEVRDEIAMWMATVGAKRLIGTGWQADARETKSGLIVPYIRRTKG